MPRIVRRIGGAIIAGALALGLVAAPDSATAQDVCGNLTVQLPNVGVFDRYRPYEDKGKAKRDSRVAIDAVVELFENDIPLNAWGKENRGLTVRVRGRLSLTEGSNNTVFRRRFAKILYIGYVAGPNCRITGLRFANWSVVSGVVQGRGRRNSHRWTRYKGVRVIRAATCRSASRVSATKSGLDEVGCTIELNPIVVTRAPLGGTPRACKEGVIVFPTIAALRLPHAGIGDTDMHGHRPQIEIKASVSRRDGFAVLSGSVRMVEYGGDRSHFFGHFSREINIAGLETSRCRVFGLTPPTGGVRADGGKDNHRWTRYPGTGLVRDAECLSDTKGNDHARLGCRIAFHPVVVRRVPGAGRRPQIAACRDRTIQIPRIDVLRLTHTGEGDKEMKGHNPEIRIQSYVERRPAGQGRFIVRVSGSVRMREGRKDWTTFEKPFSRTIDFGRLEPAGCRFETFAFVGGRGPLVAHGGKNNHRWTTYSRKVGLIRSATCLSDTRGSDDRKLGCKIEFRPITVKMQATGLPAARRGARPKAVRPGGVRPGVIRKPYTGVRPKVVRPGMRPKVVRPGMRPRAVRPGVRPAPRQRRRSRRARHYRDRSWTHIQARSWSKTARHSSGRSWHIVGGSWRR